MLGKNTNYTKILTIITKKQFQMISKLAQTRNTSMAQVIRQLIEDGLRGPEFMVASSEHKIRPLRKLNSN